VAANGVERRSGYAKRRVSRRMEGEEEEEGRGRGWTSAAAFLVCFDPHLADGQEGEGEIASVCARAFITGARE